MCIRDRLEIVRGRATSAQTLATAFAVGKTLKKKAVLAGNAFGFIGNRMVFDYVREAFALAEEGTAPARVDAVVKAFGFPMGPFAMSDLSGLDIGPVSYTHLDVYKRQDIDRASVRSCLRDIDGQRRTAVAVVPGVVEETAVPIEVLF